MLSLQSWLVLVHRRLISSRPAPRRTVRQFSPVAGIERLEQRQLLSATSAVDEATVEVQEPDVQWNPEIAVCPGPDLSLLNSADDSPEESANEELTFVTMDGTVEDGTVEDGGDAAVCYFVTTSVDESVAVPEDSVETETVEILTLEDGSEAVQRNINEVPEEVADPTVIFTMVPIGGESDDGPVDEVVSDANEPTVEDGNVIYYMSATGVEGDPVDSRELPGEICAPVDFERVDDPVIVTFGGETNADDSGSESTNSTLAAAAGLDSLSLAASGEADENGGEEVDPTVVAALLKDATPGNLSVDSTGQDDSAGTVESITVTQSDTTTTEDEAVETLFAGLGEDWDLSTAA